jgi:biopolymer transport protein ExbD
MAEVDVKSTGGKGALKAGVKRTSTKVDMTPIVDLAFLLITFFMLTTTLAKPQTMEITMPDKNKNKEDVMKVKESRTVVLLLGKNDRVYWYQGVASDENAEAPELHTTDYAAEGIRKALMQKKREIGKVPNPKTQEPEDGIIVIIKATDDATYKNMVDILDEMNITNIGTYAIVDIADVELEMIAGAEAASAGGQMAQPGG